MRTKIYSMVLVIAMMAAVPQQAEAQFLKNLGKALEKAAKDALTGNTNNNSSTSNTSRSATTKTTQSAKEKVEIPTPHETNATKKMVVRGGARYLCPFSCGVALVGHQKGWFVINKHGEKLFDLPAGYQPATYEESEKRIFENDRLMIYSDYELTKKKAAIIDVNGNIVKDFGVVTNICPFTDGLAVVVSGNSSFNWKEAYVDGDGNKVTTSMPFFDYGLSGYRIFQLREGRRRFYDPKKKRWGYCDDNCNIVIPATFSDCGSFFNGLALAKSDDGLWGFIDKKGNWAISPQYTNKPGAFRGPYSLVKDKSGVRYYMDKTGRFVWQEPNPKAHNSYGEFLTTGYTTYIKYDAGLAPAISPMIIMDSSFNQVGMVDRKVVNVFSNGKIVSYNDQWFQYQYNNYEYNVVFDWKGNPLLTFCGWGNDVFSEGMCSNSKSKCYFNDNGEIIIKFVDTQF